MGGSPRNVIVHCIFVGSIAFLAAAGSLAQADIGTIQEIPEIDESVEDPASGPISATTAAEEAAATPEEEPINRQWTLSTPAGPTAFVLDAREFEIDMPLDRLNQRVWFRSASRLWLGVKYGLTDSLTLSSTGSLYAVAVGLKWNFLNHEKWSLGVGPWVGRQFRKQYSYWGPNSQLPLGASLTASRVLDQRHKLHIGLEVARNKGQGGSDYSYYSRDFDESLLFVRMAGTYEIRLNRRHAMTLWVAGELVREENVATATGDYLWSDKYTSSAKSVMYGMGYQYLRESFGAEVGLEAGPKWQSYDSSSSTSGFDPYAYVWEHLTLGGSLVATLSYRL